ncbi:MAG: MmgE/PrpD family protein [Armatimonadetes bacterium]|nr:MmgE/PrpD family protein [Armatimonadota bacterium]
MAVTQQATVTAHLAAYASEIAFAHLPAEVVHAAKRAILDSMGCSIGGSRTEPGRLLLEFFQEIGGRPEAPVLASGVPLPLLHAAHVNAALANVLDVDDALADGHLGATVVPPAVAAAGRCPTRGRDLIAAVTAGYEVSARIGMAIKPSPERFRLVRGLGTFQVFGAASAVGRIIGLGRDAMLSAFGIAGANAPVPSVYKEGYDERPMAWVKNNFGWSAEGGVLGVLLAARGFRGQRSFLDGDRGFWRMAGSDRCDFEIMAGGLGQTYHLVNNSFKPYTCCRYHHAVLDAVGDIMGAHRLSADQVQSVHVRSIWRISEHMNYRPQDVIDAQFSLPYQVAGKVLGRTDRFDWMLTTSLSDPDLLRMADRVTYEEDEEHERLFQTVRQCGATVTIRTPRGEFTATVPHAWGSPPRPISDADLERKFVHLAGPVLGDDRARGVAALVWRLESVGDVRQALGDILGWDGTAA